MFSSISRGPISPHVYLDPGFSHRAKVRYPNIFRMPWNASSLESNVAFQTRRWPSIGEKKTKTCATVWRWKPGNLVNFHMNLGNVFIHLQLMVQKSGVHQLRLVVYPIIYRVFYIPELRGVILLMVQKSCLLSGGGNLPLTVSTPVFKNRQLYVFTIRAGICLESFWEEEEMTYSGAEVSWDTVDGQDPTPFPSEQHKKKCFFRVYRDWWGLYYPAILWLK